MSEKILQGRIMQKHGTAAEWALATTFVPKGGELIVYDPDSDNSTPRFKVGNGVDNVNDLPFSDDYIWAAIGELPTKNYVDSGDEIPNGIIDVTALPEIDINKNALYRLWTATFYFEGIVTDFISCYIVDTLPDVGEPCANADISKLRLYYALTDEVLMGYIDDVISAGLGIPVGWYPAEQLFAFGNMDYGGIVFSPKDVLIEQKYYMMLEGTLYQYNNRWDVLGQVHGDGAYAEIFNSMQNVANGLYSHAEGYLTIAGNMASHAEGGVSCAEGGASHAEGAGSKARGDASHAEGSYSVAGGEASHAEGAGSKARGDASHAEGFYSEALGSYSHAEGFYSEALGSYSHAEGHSTTAAGLAQHVEGECNAVDPEYYASNNETIRGKYIHIAGNGTDKAFPSNAYALDWSGNAYYAGDVYARGDGSNDFAGMKKLATEDAIPTKTSDLTNDSGFLTQHQSLDGYATEAYVQNYTDKAIKVTSVNGQNGDAIVTELRSGSSGATALRTLGDSNTGYGFQAGCEGGGFEFNFVRHSNTGTVNMWVNGSNQGGAIYTEGNPPPALNAYPVGAFYISAIATSPASLFGGTWEQLHDRVLIGAGNQYSGWASGGTTQYQLIAAIGAINGNTKSLGYNATGTSAYQNNHPLSNANNGYAIAGSTAAFSSWSHGTVVSEKDTNSTVTTIMPPYLAVYMWRRTA